MQTQTNRQKTRGNQNHILTEQLPEISYKYVVTICIQTQHSCTVFVCRYTERYFAFAESAMVSDHLTERLLSAITVQRCCRPRISAGHSIEGKRIVDSIDHSTPLTFQSISCSVQFKNKYTSYVSTRSSQKRTNSC